VPVGSGFVTTDDEGEFRINRLAPGSYAVMASTKETWTATENGKETVYGYMPTYFPGVIKGAQSLRSGSDRLTIAEASSQTVPLKVVVPK
jgi:hypothetical protein